MSLVNFSHLRGAAPADLSRGSEQQDVLITNARPRSRVETSAPSARRLVVEDVPSLFWTPDLLDRKSAWWGHVPFAYWIISECRPQLLVELGTCEGVSYAAFCQAAARIGLDARFYAVNSGADETESDASATTFRGLKEFHDPRYGTFSQLLRMNSAEAAVRFADKKIELLHITHSRSYEEIRDLFHAWRPKLSERAVVLIHNTSARKDDSGVGRFFRELSATFRSFEFGHGNGLGVVAVGPHAPAAITELCRSSRRGEISLVLEKFARLGEVWALKSGYAEREAHIQQLENQAQATAASQKSRLNELEKALARKTLFLAQASETIGYVSSRYAALKQETNAHTRFRRAKANATLLPEQRFFLDVVRNSVFFDAEFYRANYPEVARSHTDPAIHYLLHGGLEGKNPSPCFSSTEYFTAYPDVKASGMNPLVHYELCGREERRWPTSPKTDWTPLPPRVDTGQRQGLLARLLGREKKSPAKQNSYESWVELYDTLNDVDRELIRSQIARLDYTPLISIVMPAYNSPEGPFREAIESVRAQLYPHWELCIADDASPSPHVERILIEMAALDPRIKWTRRDVNGHISAASNSALTLATGTFVALLDHDDLLPEQALYEIAVELNAHQDADIIYSDEDRIDARGHRFAPYFKTDWNPELLLCQNMVSHLGVYRRSMLERVGGFRVGFEGSQDYDMVLRVAALTRPERIRHIPAILYHWRAGSFDGTFSGSEMQRCTSSARRAKTEYLQARGETAEVLANPYVLIHERIKRSVPVPAPLVSLIVPTRNRRDLLEPCIEGLLRRTDYAPVEIIVVDHQSDDPNTIVYLDELRKQKLARILPYEGPFNYAAMNNMAVAEAKGEIVGLINNDIDVINPDWLAEMVSLAVLPENGAIGAKLLYPTNRIQHGGVILGIHGAAGHAHVETPEQDFGYFGRLSLASNVSAVTGACMVVRKSLFEEVGGLDALNLAIAYNDVDFCLKLQAKGYRNVWTPFARLYHHESASRGSDKDQDKLKRADREIQFMRDKWHDVLDADPFFNLNLSLKTSGFDLAFPPRRVKPWLRAAR